MKEPFRELWNEIDRKARRDGVSKDDLALMHKWAEWGWDECYKEQVRRMLQSIDEIGFEMQGER